ncbi:S1 family peptidase [Herbidospora yilanensis]|uniref:S1 family peptidase n=1 Tax=Herbidospora yilanensis TaxID=354426 RepID=UPI0007854F63|nr:serine protease [Herbidospora yilanensis]
MSGEGLTASRAAEIIVTLPDGTGRRGSGYRIGTTAILTAAHVTREAATIRVRCEADTPAEWTVGATVLAVHEPLDLAVLAIDRSDAVPGVSYGSVGGTWGDVAAVVACEGLGFPRFKLREDEASSYRDLAHFTGSVPILSNRRSGTLEIRVDVPPPDAERSPWEGMSGAPVFSAGRLIAVITDHHPAEGPGRLEATRLDSLYGTDSDDLRAALGLPGSRTALTSVLSSSPITDAMEVHWAEVRSIAPRELLERSEELTALLEFCSGREPYQWWQAGPWSGKTALASTFALQEPSGLRVASFFVTARLAGQSDAAAYTAAMSMQLAEIAERSVPAVGNPLPFLAEKAAARCAERGQRLLMIIDGLDEDSGTKPSIARLLPPRPPDNLRVLVLSRPHPGIPGDVPSDHPLRSCRVHHLAPSPFARDLEVAAREELKDMLQGDDTGYDIAGLITASVGGLTATDLAELTGVRPSEIGWRIESAFGRSLGSRSHRGQAEVYLFAHETLRRVAERTLAADLPSFRARLHRWADRYRDAGWPDDTPAYLFAPYGRLVAASGDRDRLLGLATDRARHERMLALTRTDHESLAEVAAAKQALSDESSLVPHAVLSVEWSRLTERGARVPGELSAVWVGLGELSRAARMAEYLSGRDLARYGRALVAAGRYDGAEELARSSFTEELVFVWAALYEVRLGSGDAERTLDEALRSCAMGDPGTEPPAVNDRAAAAGRLRRVHRAWELFDTLPPLNTRGLLRIAVLDTDFFRGYPTGAPPHRLIKEPWGVWPQETIASAAEYLFLGSILALEDEAGRFLDDLEFRLTDRPDSAEADLTVLALLAAHDPPRGSAALAARRAALPNDSAAFHDRRSWSRLAAVLTREVGVYEARRLLRPDAFDPNTRADVLAAIFANDPANLPEHRDALVDLAAAAPNTVSDAGVLARLALTVVGLHSSSADRLGVRAELAAQQVSVRERRRAPLVIALARLGWIQEAEREADGDVRLLLDLATACSSTEPEEATRLVHTILRTQDGLVVSARDAARMSAVLARTEPMQADALAEMAVSAVRPSRLPMNLDQFADVVKVTAELPPEQADRALALLAAADEGIIGIYAPRRIEPICERLIRSAALLRFAPEHVTHLLDERHVPPGEEAWHRALRRLAAIGAANPEAVNPPGGTFSYVSPNPHMFAWILALASAAPETAVEVARFILAEKSGMVTDIDLIRALLGTPPDPERREVRSFVRGLMVKILADGRWPDVLPELAVVEPAAAKAVLALILD